MPQSLEQRFAQIAPALDYCSLRFVDERDMALRVRHGVVQPVHHSSSIGAMLTVTHAGGCGYAATSDLSTSGLRNAVQEAERWAALSRTFGQASTIVPAPEPVTGTFSSRVERAWAQMSLADKLDLLTELNAKQRVSDEIVDSSTGLWHSQCESLLIDTLGTHISQQFQYLVPHISATANDGYDTQSRSLGGNGFCRQGGLEVLDDVGFYDCAENIGHEAVELLHARNCPTGKVDLLLAPDQMILQIHESIGHPLELDRILGDERNYAGTSFVTQEMFGRYQYGSELLNVSYDPSMSQEFASYAFDDEGTPATKQFLIRDGLLERGLGGRTSQTRSAIDGVANSRACSWNRPPIDRMANLNLEAGTSPFAELVASIEHGIYMQANVSWSIDDSRNKFQFGCERGQLIKNGELTEVVKKPNYRGVSATFWRNLTGVGSAETLLALGTPYCGKGEPNQCVRVGHAAPACVFSSVDVFGGE